MGEILAWLILVLAALALWHFIKDGILSASPTSTPKQE